MTFHYHHYIRRYFGNLFRKNNKPTPYHYHTNKHFERRAKKKNRKSFISSTLFSCHTPSGKLREPRSYTRAERKIRPNRVIISAAARDPQSPRGLPNSRPLPPSAAMPNEQNTPRCRSRESRARTRKSEPKTKEGGALEITVDRVSCTSSSRERAADKIRKKGGAHLRYRLIEFAVRYYPAEEAPRVRKRASRSPG